MVAKVKNLVALAPVLGAILRPVLLPRRALALPMCHRQYKGSSWPDQLTQKETRQLGEQNQRTLMSPH